MSDHFTAEEAMKIVNNAFRDVLSERDKKIAALEQKVADLESQNELVSVGQLEIPKFMLPIIIGLSEAIHTLSGELKDNSKRASGILLAKDADKMYDVADAPNDTEQTVTTSVDFGDVVIRGDSLLFAVDNSDDDSADPEPLPEAV